MATSCTMADAVRSLVMVENETYELIDGDGNFYVSKRNLGPISSSFQATDPFATLANTDYHETFSTTTDNQISPMNQLSMQLPSVAPPQSNMEPILIHDYGKMNFFTQAASNVTIYLNSDTGDTFINDGYSQDSNEVIDLTTSSSEDCRKQCEREDQDQPEFIDLSQLKIPYEECFFDGKEEEIKQEVVRSSDVMEIEEDDDNDVVFVKEYKIDDDAKGDEDSLPLDLRSRSEDKGKATPEPRRNPKRTVQLLKEYYNGFKYNTDSYGKGKKRRECCDSKKKPGAVLNPPSVLTNEHFKEWPAEGMHEKPTYNVASKKLENFENNEKKKGPVRKMKEVIKKKPFKKGRRRMGKAKAKEEVDERVSKEFATLTHETLQDVIGYVQQLKEYSNVIKGMSDKGNDEKLENAKDILTSSCILYSIANDVPQKSVSKYLKTIAKEF